MTNVTDALDQARPVPRHRPRDLSEEFVDAARYLTERSGQSEQASFQSASALELPFDASRFGVVLLQHVAMNLAERMRLYRETRRVLKPDFARSTANLGRSLIEGQPGILTAAFEAAQVNTN